jgi:hypothetical protein
MQIFGEKLCGNLLGASSYVIGFSGGRKGFATSRTYLLALT